MDEGLKRRLIGATVLVSMAVIFVPMLLEREPEVDQAITHPSIPPRPSQDFSSRILPLEEKQGGDSGREVSAVDRGAAEPADQTPPPVLPEAQVPDRETSTAPSVSAGNETTTVESRVGLSSWIIQVGSFSKRGNAGTLIEELRKKGFPAFIEQAEVKGQQVFRVRVGPELDKERAEKMLSELNSVLKAKKLQGKLKRYP